MCIQYLKGTELGTAHDTAFEVSSLSFRQGSLVLDMDVEDVEVGGSKGETTTAA